VKREGEGKIKTKIMTEEKKRTDIKRPNVPLAKKSPSQIEGRRIKPTNLDVKYGSLSRKRGRGGGWSYKTWQKKTRGRSSRDGL